LVDRLWLTAAFYPIAGPQVQTVWSTGPQSAFNPWPYSGIDAEWVEIN